MALVNSTVNNQLKTNYSLHFAHLTQFAVVRNMSFTSKLFPTRFLVYQNNLVKIQLENGQ
jgi:hypothetical protein